MRLPRTLRISSARQVVDALAVEPHLAAHDAPGGSSRPMTAAPVSDLPAPDFAHHAQHLAGRDVERDAVDGRERAAAASGTPPAGRGRRGPGSLHSAYLAATNFM